MPDPTLPPQAVTPPLPVRTSMKDHKRPAESYREHLERILLTVTKRRMRVDGLEAS